MRLMPIITFIKDGVAELTHVGPAESLTGVPEDILLPAAYVHPAVDKARENGMLGMNVSQEQDTQFAVLIVARNINVASGIEELEDMRDKIKTALIGQQPTANHSPIEFVGGQIADVDSQRIIWRDIYQTMDLLRA